MGIVTHLTSQNAASGVALARRWGPLYRSRSELRHSQSRAREETVAGHRFLTGAALRENISFRAANSIYRRATGG